MNFILRVIFMLLLLSSGLIYGQTQTQSGEAREQDKPDKKISQILDKAKVLQSKQDSSALSLARQAVLLSFELRDSSEMVRNVLQAVSLSNDFFKFDRSWQWLKKIQPPPHNLDRQVLADLYKVTGITQKQRANYVSAEEAFDEALEIYSELGDSVEKYEVISELADNFRYQGEYQQAAEYWYRARKHYETVGDSQKIMITNEGIAILNYLQGETEKADRLFKQNLNFYRRNEDSSQLAFTLSAMGLIEFSMRNYEKSIEYSRRSFEIRKKIDDVRGQGESLNNLALAYMGKGEWEEARKYLFKSRSALTEGNDFRQIPTILSNIGDTYRQLHKPDSALFYYKQAIREARFAGQGHTLSLVYKDISQLMEDEGDLKKALHYMRRFTHTRDSLFTQEKARKIEELEARYESERKDQAIVLLEQEKQNERNRNIILVGGILLLGIIFVLVVIQLRTKMKNNKVRFQQEKKLLRTKEELTQAELKNARQQLAYNKSKLENHAKSLMQKNELIEELESKINDMPSADERAEAERLRKLQELEQMKILTDDDWEEFRNLFDQVYGGFSMHMKEQHPDLTAAEQRLFILLKLNLSSKEISGILGVSPDSVKKSRYRLRKKLDLEGENSLEEYISSFTAPQTA